MIPEKLLTLSMTPKKGRRVVVLEAGAAGCACLDDDVFVLNAEGGCSRIIYQI